MQCNVGLGIICLPQSISQPDYRENVTKDDNEEKAQVDHDEDFIAVVPSKDTLYSAVTNHANCINDTWYHEKNPNSFAFFVTKQIGFLNDSFDLHCHDVILVC